PADAAQTAGYRSNEVSSVPSRSDRAVRSIPVQTIDHPRGLRRDVAAAQVGAHLGMIAAAGIAVAAAAAGMNADVVTGGRDGRSLQSLPRRPVGGLDQDVAGLAVASAGEAPGRTDRSLETGGHATGRQQQVAPRQARPAAELAVAAGIGAQAKAL